MLLAIDTATRGISLALHDGSRVIAEASWETANRHTVELAPAIDEMLAQAKLTVKDVSAVAVALGPGSFTGLRIGLAMAKGLATSLEIPVLGIPTLEVLATSQPCFDGDLIAVLQAGRGRICAQRFSHQDGAWVAQDEPAIVPWEDLVEGISEGQSVLVSGEINVMGMQHLAAAAESGKPIATAPVAERLRRAGYLADRAWARLRANDTDDPFTLVPIYLHQPGVPHP